MKCVAAAGNPNEKATFIRLAMARRRDMAPRADVERSLATTI